MEASLSRRATPYRRISITFRKIASEHQYGNQKSGLKFLLSSGFYYRIRY
jgi:hypothetical protein